MKFYCVPKTIMQKGKENNPVVLETDAETAERERGWSSGWLYMCVYSVQPKITGGCLWFLKNSSAFGQTSEQPESVGMTNIYRPQLWAAKQTSGPVASSYWKYKTSISCQFTVFCSSVWSWLSPRAVCFSCMWIWEFTLRVGLTLSPSWEQWLPFYLRILFSLLVSGDVGAVFCFLFFAF